MTAILVEISNVRTSELPVLNNDDMNNLFSQLPNKQAREKIINGNLRLVLSIVQRFKNRNEQLDDLFQIGCIGLIKAIDNFDLSRNIKFSTYAFPTIYGEIRRYFRDNSIIKTARKLKSIAYKSLQIKEQSIKDKGYEPSIDDIAKQLNATKQEIYDAINSVQGVSSLYEPTGNNKDGDEVQLIDQIADNESDDNWINDITIKTAINKLEDKQKNIIVNRYFNDKTQYEISKEIGISQAQVSRLEKDALKRMKNLIN